VKAVQDDAGGQGAAEILPEVSHANACVSFNAQSQLF
jgi:hypothetical protein